MGNGKKAAVLALAAAAALHAGVPATGAEGNTVKSSGNLVYADGDVAFYAGDLENLDAAIDGMVSEVTEGRRRIVEALHARGVGTDVASTFSGMPAEIIKVEQRVYIGIRKVEAEIIYRFHYHTYNGEKTGDSHNNAMFGTADGCYTKAVYGSDGRLKGYTVGCGYVEEQIVAADVVEKGG